MIRLLSAMCVFACTCVAFATTIPKVPLAELFQKADVVALVQVTEGRTLGTGEETCGASYEAIVVAGLKGANVGSTIKFGHNFGFEVGTQYILFLVKPDRPFDPKMSMNSEMERMRGHLNARCSSQWPDLTVMHSGNGALPVSFSAQFNYKDSVRVASRFVGIPPGVEVKAAMPSDIEEFSGVVWVRLDDMLKLLQQFAK